MLNDADRRLAARNRSKRWNVANKERVRETTARWYAANKEKVKVNVTCWRAANPDRVRGYSVQRRLLNGDKLNAAATRWRKANPDKMKASVARWRATNPNYRRDRRRTNINYRLRLRLQARLREAFKGGTKSATTLKLLGCSVEELRRHLESRFTGGMSWENYGEWHIDHRRPCAAFDLTDPEQQRQCFNWSNLQPLWAKDNLRKSSKMEAA